MDGQRPFSAALQAFTVPDTWNVLEPQITAPKPCGSQTREFVGASFLEQRAMFLLFVCPLIFLLEQTRRENQVYIKGG